MSCNTGSGSLLFVDVDTETFLSADRSKNCVGKDFLLKDL